MSLLDPLLFLPKALPKVWGGRRLQDFLPGGLGQVGPIGEVWTVADRGEMSSEVGDGPLAGRNLTGLMLSEREDLLGSAHPSADGRFPLLVKYLDAAEPLSVQVHPDARRADMLGGEPKDECWYVLAAEPEAHVFLGLLPGVDAATFAAEASSHHVVDLLQRHAVRAGEFLSVPAGTVHAIGAGVTLVEVQENADTTWRLFDWDRPGLDGKLRPLHLDYALRAIDYDRVPQGPLEAEYKGTINARATLLEGPAFSVEAMRINEAVALDTGGRPWVYVVLSGKGSLVTERGEWRIGRGESWLMPAALGQHRFCSADGELEVLRVEAH